MQSGRVRRPDSAPPPPPPPLAREDHTSVRRSRRTVREDAVGEAAVTLAAEMTMPRQTLDARRPTRGSLDPREAWILSLVDGNLSVEDLADVTSIPKNEVIIILEKLVEHGYVAIGRFR
jgi:hypothetical protein